MPEELFEHWKERDPIRRLERDLIKRDVISASGIDEMQNRINAEIDEAIQIAEKDPYPAPEDCVRDVYFEGEELT